MHVIDDGTDYISFLCISVYHFRTFCLYTMFLAAVIHHVSFSLIFLSIEMFLVSTRCILYELKAALFLYLCLCVPSDVRHKPRP